YLCAGGSMPNLPRTTDGQLLAAIPRMSPWAEASKDGRWVLRETGKQMLVFGGGELDLTHETGVFRANTINVRTGELTSGQAVQAGSIAKLPNSAVVWLTKE